jgi:glycosyltransferase involved in cell wall biosynthesis
MRIGIITHLKYPIREPFAGGLEMHTYALTRHLQERGHQVTLFATPNADPELNVEPMHIDELHYDLLSNAERNTDKFSELFVQEHHAYLKLMLRLADDNRFDVIHNNSLHYLPVSMAPTVATPMITTLHTPPFSWLQSAVRNEQPYRKIQYVSVSRQNLQTWAPYVSPDVCRVIYNGVDLSRWRFGAQSDRRTALWFGRIVPEKGTHLAIEAAHLAGLRIIIAGPVCDERYFSEEVQPRLRPADTYAGHLTHRQLADLLGGVGVMLCTPRWEEPYGLVVAESLACGTPVAAFARGALPEIINPEVGCLALSDNVESLAEAARKALELSRRACREWAETFCSVEAMVSAYEELYEEMALPRVEWRAS